MATTCFWCEDTARLEEVDEARVGAREDGLQFLVDARGVGNLLEDDSSGGDRHHPVWICHGFGALLERKLVVLSNKIATI